MPGLFVFAIIIAVFTVIAGAVVLGSRKYKGQKARNGDFTGGAITNAVAKVISVFLLSFTALLLTVSSFNIVGTRDIGIVTSFGRLAGHIGPGIAWTAPWDSVTPIDDAYQLTDDTFLVKIAGGQTAKATVQLRWNASPQASDDIFQNYKTTAGVESGLLLPELNVAGNSVLDGYDPLAALASGAKAGTPGNPSTSQLGAQIEAALASRVGGDINIRTFALQPLVYDNTVTNRISSVISQVASTDRALQAVKTAQAQAAANLILENSLAKNPLALVQQCFTGLADGQITLPAGGSCWPGSGSSVVIPAVSK